MAGLSPDLRRGDQIEGSGATRSPRKNFCCVTPVTLPALPGSYVHREVEHGLLGVRDMKTHLTIFAAATLLTAMLYQGQAFAAVSAAAQTGTVITQTANTQIADIDLDLTGSDSDG